MNVDHIPIETFPFYEAPNDTLPPPPRLFSLDPFGLGTAFQESFPSYLNRLCLAHGAPSMELVRRELVPRIFPGWHHWRRFLTQHRPSFLVVSHPSSRGGQFARGLAGLTGVPAVANLQQSFLAQGVTIAAHLRSHLAWCPHCLKKDTFSVPLLWAFRPVVYCPTHRVPLVDRCPTCKRRFPHWGQRSWDPGCCSCGQPLFREPGKQFSDAPANDWEVRAASFVADLLEWGARLDGPFSIEHFLFPNIAAAASAVGGPTALAGFAGIARLAPCSSKQPFPFSQLLRLSLVFNVSPSVWLARSVHPSVFYQPVQVPAKLSFLSPVPTT
jgi:hypothetical protein